jgi:hypothetical protein
MSRDRLGSPDWMERERARRAARQEGGYAAFMAAAGEPRAAYSLAGAELAPEEAAYAAFAGNMGIRNPASVGRAR